MKGCLYDIYKGFLTWFDGLYCAFKPPLCKAKQLEKMFLSIQPGDIICRGYNYYLDSRLILGEYSHSSLVISKKIMIHVISTGVDVIHPIDYVKDTDRFMILRPKYTSDILKQKVLDRAKWHKINKTEYDFTFKNNNKYYCHEFTADCLSYGEIILDRTLKEFGVWPIKFKRNLFMVDNIIEKCDKVYEFNP
jgi:hypothetical protein